MGAEIESGSSLIKTKKQCWDWPRQRHLAKIFESEKYLVVWPIQLQLKCHICRDMNSGEQRAVWQRVLCDMSLTLPAAPLSTRATSFIQCQWSRTELCCSLMSGDSMMKNNLLWGETELYDWLTPTLTIDAGALNPVNSMIQSNNRDFKYHICRQELFWRFQHIFVTAALVYKNKYFYFCLFNFEGNTHNCILK